MSKYIVCVFDTEASAYEGSRAIKDLANEGNIALYAGAIVVRDNDGTLRVVDAADEGPIGTATGALTGMLIGMLGGPAGMAVGTMAGSMGGLVYDLSKAGVDAQFVQDVSEQLSPGKSAVIAEVSEGWTIPLDTRMKELGGTILRKFRFDVEDEQFEREAAAAKQEMDDLKADLKDASDQTKADIKARIDAEKKKIQDLKSRAETRLKEINDEANAQVAALDEAIKKSTGEAKDRFERRRSEIKEDISVRQEKLQHAGQLIGEALS